jgi:hypothetical protein
MPLARNREHPDISTASVASILLASPSRADASTLLLGYLYYFRPQFERLTINSVEC